MSFLAQFPPHRPFKSGWKKPLSLLFLFPALILIGNNENSFGQSNFDSLKVNRVQANVNARGNLGVDLGNNNWLPGLQYPSSSPEKTLLLFTNALWVGGYDPSDSLHLSKENYWMDDFYPGPAADGYDLNYDARYQRTWKLDRDTLEYHDQNWSNNGYQVPQMIQEWPAHGDTSNGEAYHLAPFKDLNDNGIYEPQQGDRPIIWGDRAIYFISNDIRGPHDSSDAPLGVEVHGMIYAFDCPDNSTLENSLMFHYDIINRSNTSYDSVMLGNFSDYDIGCATDDHVGSDVERGIAFGYNGDGYDEACQGLGGYDTILPAVGNVFLKGPELEANNTDDVYGGPGKGSVNGVGFGDGIVDNELWGMQYALYYNNDQSPRGNPNSNQDHYNYMTGSWRDSIPVSFGGDGYDPLSTQVSDTLSHHMFPGDTDPQHYSTYGVPAPPWSEETAGNSPGDRRIVASSGPGNLSPGDTMKLDMAYVIGQDPNSPGNNTAPIPVMKERVDTLRSYFLADSVPCSSGSFSSVQEQKAPSFEVEVYPNPSDERFNVELKEGNNKAYRYELYNMQGALIQEGSWQGGGRKSLELSSERSGIHFLRIRSGKGSKVLKLVKR